MDINYINQLINDGKITKPYAITWLTENANDIKDIYFNNFDVFVVKNNGEIWCCGENNFGELGLEDEIEHTEFTKLPDIFNNPKFIACSNNTTFIVNNDGIVYSCGSNKYGELGVFIRMNKVTKFKKVAEYFKNPKQIFCFDTNTFLVTQNNILYGCGANHYGQLGVGDEIFKVIFTKTNINFPIKTIKQTYKATMILDENNNIYAAGDDDNLDQYFDTIPQQKNIFNKTNVTMPANYS